MELGISYLRSFCFNKPKAKLPEYPVTASLDNMQTTSERSPVLIMGKGRGDLGAPNVAEEGRNFARGRFHSDQSLFCDHWDLDVRAHITEAFQVKNTLYCFR